RMARNVRQHRLTLGNTIWPIGLAEHALRAGLMRIGIEHERAGRAEKTLPADKGPARDDARKGGDVVLRVAAVHAERMQLHDLARKVFVQAAMAIDAGARVRSQRLLIVEEE